MDDTSIKQIMIQNAKEVVVVADSSKFEKVAFTFISSFEKIHQFVTNEMPPKALMTSLKKFDVNVHVVGEVEAFVI